MNDVRHDELVRLSLKRELTPEEESRLEAWLAGNPAARAEWEADRALGRALQALPDVPVSSNFTARVLQEVDWEERRAERARGRSSFRSFLPRLGWGLAALLACAGLFYQYRAVQNDNRRLAETVKNVSGELAALPAPEVLGDFDAINSMLHASSTPVAARADDDLLRAFQ